MELTVGENNKNEQDRQIDRKGDEGCEVGRDDDDMSGEIDISDKLRLVDDGVHGRVCGIPEMMPQDDTGQ